MPRWARAVTISRPSGVASTTTATLTSSRTLSHSIAPADVLHVVEAVEVGAGHARVGVVEAGGDDEPVEGDVGLAPDADPAGGEVERR